MIKKNQFVTTILLLCICMPVVADEALKTEKKRHRDSIKKLEEQFTEYLKKGKKTFAEKVEAERRLAIKTLSKARDEAAIAIDLKTANELQAEIDRLAKEVVRPPIPEFSDGKQMQSKIEKLEVALEKEKNRNRELTNKLKNIRRDSEQVLLRHRATITSKSPIGYVLGPLKKGDQVSLQYLDGKWKSWGRYPTESPDDIKSEHGDKCRVAMGFFDKNAKFQLLGIVPPETAETPFRWKSNGDYQRVILRINDANGSFKNNPDGNVRYEVTVTR